MRPAREMPDKSVKIVVCPGCKGDSVFAVGNPYRPFCSKRCKDIDLGAWASESFRMPADVSLFEAFDDATPHDPTI